MMRSLDHLPDIWGEGAIFAFSGLDGPTDTLSQFVATLGDGPYNLLIHTPRRRVLAICPSCPGAVVAATNDVLAVETPGGELVVTFAAWHTIVGVVPEGTRLALSFEGEPALAVSENLQTSWDAGHQDALVLVVEHGRFALAYGCSRAKAHARARQGLTTSLAQLLSQRLAIYRRLPAGHVPALASPARERLLKKCVSVIKVNTLAPEGFNRQTWSTPDRVPHRHMWLWDSVFHSFGMNYLDPQVAWLFLQSVLERQQPDGMIPHMMQVDGRVSEITQPPILAWGVWRNYQLTQNPEQLAYALPRLERYLDSSFAI